MENNLLMRDTGGKHTHEKEHDTETGRGVIRKSFYSDEKNGSNRSKRTTEYSQ